MKPNSEPSERIQRLTYRYQTEMPKISIDRAKFYTEKWLETENKDISMNVRVALSMKNVYEKMRHHVDPDDRIAGYWTESFLGMPIDVERGVFNGVLQNELKKGPLIKLRIKSVFKTLGYLLKRHEVINFIKNQKIMKSMGTQPMNLGIKTMMEREINPYTIDEDDKQDLLKEILPIWKGKTTVEILERDMYALNLLEENMKFFNKAVPANNSKQTTMISPCATISTYMGHLIIDYENIVKKGLLVMKSEVEQRLNGGKNSEEQKNFLESVRIALEGVMTFARRLADKIEEAYEFETDLEKKAILKQMLDNCKKVPLNPPESFYEAVQAAWTVKTAVELAHPVNLHCFGRMDQIFYPYYKKDLDQGKITPDQARELLEELLLKVMSQNIRPESNLIGNFYHRFLGSTPITLGGKNPDGTDATNDLTYLFIEYQHFLESA